MYEGYNREEAASVKKTTTQEKKETKGSRYPSSSRRKRGSLLDRTKETVYGVWDYAAAGMRQKKNKPVVVENIKPPMAAKKIQKGLLLLTDEDANQKNNPGRIRVPKGVDTTYQNPITKTTPSRTNDFDALKERVYAAGDAVGGTYNAVQNSMRAAAAATRRTVRAARSLPATIATTATTVEETVEKASRLPTQIATAAESARNNTVATVEQCRRVAEDMRDLPARLSQTRRDLETRVEDWRVAWKLQPPVPRPPRTPPPQLKTWGEIGRGLAGQLAVDVAGGVAWSVREAAVRGWQAAVAYGQPRSHKDQTKSSQSRGKREGPVMVLERNNNNNAT